MDKLNEILEDIRPDIDFDSAESLVDGNILDSFDIITLVSRINEELGIEISVEELIPENFNSKKAMEKLIEKYQ